MRGPLHGVRCGGLLAAVSIGAIGACGQGARNEPRVGARDDFARARGALGAGEPHLALSEATAACAAGAGAEPCELEGRLLIARGRTLLDLGLASAAARDLEGGAGLVSEAPDAALLQQAEIKAAIAALARGETDAARGHVDRARALGAGDVGAIAAAIQGDPPADVALDAIGSMARALVEAGGAMIARRWFSAYFDRGGHEPAIARAAFWAFLQGGDDRAATRAAAVAGDADLACATAADANAPECDHAFQSADPSDRAVAIARFRGFAWHAPAAAAAVESGLHGRSFAPGLVMLADDLVADDVTEQAPDFVDPIAAAALARLAGDQEGAREILLPALDRGRESGVGPARTLLEAWAEGLPLATVRSSASSASLPAGTSLDVALVEALIDRASLDPAAELRALEDALPLADAAGLVRLVDAERLHGDLVPAIAICETRLATRPDDLLAIAERERLLAALRGASGRALLAGETGGRRRARWRRAIGDEALARILAEPLLPPSGQQIDLARRNAEAEGRATGCSDDLRAAPAAGALVLLLLRAGDSAAAEDAAWRYAESSPALVCRATPVVQALADGGDLGIARSLADAMVGEAPDDGAAARLRAAIEIASGAFGAAMTDLQESAYDAGDDAGAAFADGALLFERAGDYTDACALWNRADSWGGGDRRPLAAATIACLSRAGRAIEALEVKRSQPAPAEPSERARARDAIEAGDLTSARRLIEPLLTRRPLDRELCELEARVLRAAGDGASAAPFAERAEALDLPLAPSDWKASARSKRVDTIAGEAILGRPR